MFELDLEKMFVPQESLLELVVRGTFMYFALFLVLRIVIRRHVGTLEMSDLLMMVLIADAAQNGMASDYKSFTAGVVLCGTIIFWSYLLDVLACHWHWFGKIVGPPPRLLILHGKVQRHNLKRENLTEDSLESQLRQHGVDDFSVVKRAFVESDGQISVIRYDGGQSPPPVTHKKKPEAL